MTLSDLTALLLQFLGKIQSVFVSEMLSSGRLSVKTWPSWPADQPNTPSCEQLVVGVTILRQLSPLGTRESFTSFEKLLHHASPPPALPFLGL
jgi:hypothetical protein